MISGKNLMYVYSSKRVIIDNFLPHYCFSLIKGCSMSIEMTASPSRLLWLLLH